MIDEKKLIEELEKQYNHLIPEDDTDYARIHQIKQDVKIIKSQPKVGEWIPCKDGKNLPPERDSIFMRFKGTDKWDDAMFEKISDDVDTTIEFDDRTRCVRTMHTTDGIWKHESVLKPKVVAWRPKPEPYKEGDAE